MCGIWDLILVLIACLMKRIVIFSSYGNDSVALIQYLHDKGIKGATVLYSDTGWSAQDWLDRVTKAEDWVRSLGYDPQRTQSIGFPDLVRKKQIFPRGQMQFCTQQLKIAPAEKWLETFDPDGTAVCATGVRRAESVRRRTQAEFVWDSPNHGGRSVWYPLVYHMELERNDLVIKAGFEVLPHRSLECNPCIFANRKDLRKLAEYPERIDEIRALEEEITEQKGRSNYLFRPQAFAGATGIDEVVAWGQKPHGNATKTPGLIDEPDPCDQGFCGL